MLVSPGLSHVEEQTVAANNALNDAQFRLYRGEGSHDRPSYYPSSGPGARAGMWWTTDRTSAQNYAASAKGQVYSLDVHPHETEPSWGTYHLVPDPAVRARRKPVES